MILQYKGIKVFYKDEGKGQAVVLLHGFLEDSSMWKDVTKKITKKNRAITIDLLGHGKSECLGYVHTMEDQANMVLAVLKHLRLRRYFMIGHSMGGYIALAFAENNPDTLKGLCLMNSTYEADDEELKTRRTKANKMVQTNFESMVRVSFANLFSAESKVTYKTEFEAALKIALKTPLQGYIANQEGMRLRKDSFKIYKSLNCKKLIIIGEKDPVVNGKKLIKEVKNTTIETALFSEGHMSHIENKDKFLFAIMHFIEKA